MSPRRLMPVGLVLLLLAGTLVVAATALHYERDHAEERAQVAAERAAAVAELALGTASGSLADTAGLFDASDSVTQEAFAAFGDRVLGRGGLTSVGWLERVPEADRAAYEARTGTPIVERDGAGTRPAGTRTEHFPLTFLATELRLGRGVLGLDPSIEPRRRAALARAAAGDATAMTAPLELYGDGERGVLLCQPVYAGGGPPDDPAARRRALRGFVVGAYRLDTLMSAVHRAVDHDTPVEIRDGDVLLSAAAPGASRATGVEIDVGGRRWTVLAARPAVSWTAPAMLLAGGLVVSLLAAALAVVIARRDRFATAAVRRATSELRASRRSHRALAENSPDIVARYDPDLRCTYVNAAVSAATGLAPERFVGRTSAEAGAPPELVQLWEDALRRAFAGDEDVEVAFPLPTPAGRRWFQSRLAPERDADGRIVNVLAVTRDVTRQTIAERALRASEDRYRILIATLSDGVIVQDAAGAIVSWNPAAEAILGLTAAQLSGRESIDPRWHAVREDGSPYPGEEHPAMRTLRSGEPLDGEVMGVHRPDGGLVWLSVATRPRDEDGDRSVTVCFTDITARVEADREQAALRRVAMLVAADADASDVLELVAREAATLIGAEAAGVVRFDEALREGTVVGVHAPGRRTGAGASFDLALPTAAGRVAATGAVVRLGDGAPVHPNLLIPDERVASAVAAPIRVDNRLWGALTAVTTRADAPLAPGTGDRLARLCEPIALAIMSSEARARLATLAGTDDLTGLPNRRTFTEALASEIERARRYGRQVSLVMLDIDHFKRVNDRHGHPAGDRVLMGVAAQLFANVRDTEIVARVGGEEFAWILPETDGAAAALAAERVRRHMASVVFEGVGSVTLSMGVCDLGEAGTAGDLMRLADSALYRAKAAGRDRVERHVSRPQPALAGASRTG